MILFFFITKLKVKLKMPTIFIFSSGCSVVTLMYTDQVQCLMGKQLEQIAVCLFNSSAMSLNIRFEGVSLGIGKIHFQMEDLG